MKLKITGKLKIIGVVAAVILGVLVVASFLASRLIDQDKYKSLIVEKVADATGYQVNWDGNIKISLLPVPHVSLRTVSIDAQKNNIARIDHVSVDVNLVPLFSGRVVLGDVVLDKPVITLTVDKYGRKLWDVPKKSDEQAPVAQEPAIAESDAGEKSAPVSFGKIVLRDGLVVYDDQSAGEKTTISSINLAVQTGVDGGPYIAQGGLKYNDIAFEIDAKTTNPQGENQLPLRVMAQLPDMKVRLEYSGVVTTSGDFSAQGDLKILADDLRKSVSAFSIEGGKKIPEEIAGVASVEGTLLYSRDEISAKNVKITAGRLSYLGDFSIAHYQADKPVLSLSIEPEKKNAAEKGDGVSSASIISVLDDLTVRGQGSVSNGSVIVDRANVAFDGAALELSGRYDPARGASSKPNVTLQLTSPRLDLDDLMRYFKDGDAAASLKNASSAPAAAKDSSAEKGKEAVATLPFNGAFNIRIGDVLYGNQAYKDIVTVFSISGPALKISEFSAAFKPDSKISVQGVVGDVTALQGLDVRVHLNVADVDATLKSMDIEQGFVKKAIGAAQVVADLKGSVDQLSFNADVAAMGYKVSGQGSVREVLQSPVINNVDLTLFHPQFGNAMRVFQPDFRAGSSLQGAMNIATSLSWADGQYRVSKIDGKIGATTIKGDVVFDPKKDQSVPFVKGEFVLGDLVMGGTTEAYKPVVSQPSSSKSSASSSGEARWSRESIDTAWMRAFDADLVVKARSVSYDLWMFANPSLVIKLDNGVLTVSEAAAGLFGGKALLQGNVESGSNARDPLSMEWHVTASDVDAGKLHSAIVRKKSDTISGTISALDVKAVSSGVSPASLIYALDGKGHMQGNNLVVKGVDAAQLAQTAKGSFKPVDRAGSLLSSFKGGQTEFSVFESVFNIDDGIVDFSKIIFDGAKASISGVGQVNLPQWLVDLKISMTVKNTDIPPFDMSIRGPLDNPAQAGGAVIENYLRSKVQNKVQKLLGKELEKRFGVPQGSEPVAEPANEPVTSTPSSADPVVTGAPDEALPESAVPEESAPEEEKPEDALKKEAVKALQGLFAQ